MLLAALLILISVFQNANARSPELKICEVTDYGAKGDGRTDDTRSIQRAIDDCYLAGGGVVSLRQGVFLSGTIRVKSGIELRIERSATIKGQQIDESYPALFPLSFNTELKDCRRALVYIENAHDVAITGGGTIDGSGHNPAWTGPEYTRPMGVFMALSRRVIIEDITVKDAGMWGVVSLESERIVLRRLQVDSTIFPNRDGIDIVDSHHVLIEGGTVNSGDDAICLKSGSAVGVRDVTVRGVRVRGTGSNALKIGTATRGTFEKVRFENIRIDHADKAAMAVMSVDGGSIRDVSFSGIRFQNAGSAFFVLLGRRLFSPSVGSIDRLEFHDIQGVTVQSWGSVISGTRGLFADDTVGRVLVRDVLVRKNKPYNLKAPEPPEYSGLYPDPPMWGDLPTNSIFIRHADQVRMENVRFVTN